MKKSRKKDNINNNVSRLFFDRPRGCSPLTVKININIKTNVNINNKHWASTSTTDSGHRTSTSTHRAVSSVDHFGLASLLSRPLIPSWAQFLLSFFVRLQCCHFLLACLYKRSEKNLPHLNGVQWWWGERQKRNVSQFPPFSLHGSPIQSADGFVWSFQSRFFQLTSSSSLSITPFFGSFIFFHFLPGHYNPEWLNNNDLWQSSKNSSFEIF